MTVDEIREIYGDEYGRPDCDVCPVRKGCTQQYLCEECWVMITGAMLGKSDPVNHPAHYTQGSIECIDAMQAAFGEDELATYCKIAAFKYLWRSKLKGHPIEDMKKAAWYINKHIELADK